MKFFSLEADEKNKNPFNINKNRALDIRLLQQGNIKRMSMWNIVEMEFPMEGFFPDLICSPCIMLSEMLVKTVVMYHPEIPYKAIKLWDRKSGANATYYLPILDELECMSDQTEFNSVGNRVVRLVLDRRKIGSKAVFRIKGFDRNCIIGRLDFVESILRRGAGGIRLTEIDID